MTHPNIRLQGNPLLVGCLVVLAVILVGGAATASWLLGRPALSAFNAARDLARIELSESQVSSTVPFEPPAGGELTEQHLERYLAVSREVMASLGGHMDVLDERYQELSDLDSFSGFRQAIFAWSDLLRLVAEAKDTQIDALNANGFSLAEYAWVRSQALRAAGVDYFMVDFAQLVADSSDPIMQQEDPEVPRANVELVAPYAQELMRLAPLAAFGL